MAKYTHVQAQAMTTICWSPKKEVILSMKLHFPLIKQTSRRKNWLKHLRNNRRGTYCFKEALNVDFKIFLTHLK